MMAIDPYVKLMAEGFMNDPGVKFQLNGLTRGKELFEFQCKGEIEAFMENGCVTLDNHGSGLLIGYFTKALTEEKLLECMQKSGVYMLQALKEEEAVCLQENVMRVAEISQGNWYEKYVGNQEVFVLQTIVIAEQLRGTGAFRKLISPILEQCEKTHIPVVLQTHNAENVPKYQHLGFKVMEQISSPEIDLTCYGLLKA